MYLRAGESSAGEPSSQHRLLDCRQIPGREHRVECSAEMFQQQWIDR
jgi:hypothetical protein